MRTLEFLSQLNGSGIRIWADQGNLRYSAPRGALTKELRTSLIEHKEKLLSFLTIKPITRRNEATVPLSFAQQRLWFIDQLEPNTAAYNIPIAVRFRGKLDEAALAASFNEIVRRHEALRTSFVLLEGSPQQLIAPVLRVAIPSVDLRGFSEAEREREALRITTQEAQIPFDLAAVPLIRVKLLKLQEQEHVVVLVMHHIVSDGWSMGVLVRELGAVYEAYCEGKPSPLPELPIQYGDFAVWQRERLAAVKDEQLGYWQQQLAEVSRLQLPLDHPRPAVPSFQGATKSFVIKRELLAELKTLSQSHGVTLFMTLLAAFKVLLSRYSGQADIAVGTPIANRQRAELEPLIGFFVNTLVLRTDVANDPSFAELMGRVRAVALGAYQHQELPFAQLVEELQPERSLSQTPLFQVMFVLQNAPLSELALGDLELTPVAVESGIARFELTLVMEETAAGLAGTLEYNRDLFAAETISRMAGHLESLLAAIVTDPSQRISELPLLTAAEQRHLLVEWNETAADYATDKCIHKLFEQQTVRTPGAIAVVDGEQSLTYRELNLRANQLAHYLKALGVGTEVVVGICVERSVELVVGWLGILKAGAAYLPIDPAYPAERIAFILAESCSPVVLTQARLVERLGGGQIWSAVTCQRFGPCDLSPEVATEELIEGSKAFSEAARQQAAAGQSGDRSPHSKFGSPQHQREVLCLDADWGRVSGCSEQNPDHETGAEQLAYVIYTSGSTGRPKGVEIEHGSLLNLVQWHQRSYGIGPCSRASQLAGPGFDAAGWEIWPYLATGGSIHITPEEIRNSPAALVKWLGEESITISFLPTPLAEAVIAEAWPAGIALQDVLTGGDQLQRRPGRELPFRLVNHYGPTESTVVATATVVEAGPGGRPAIGKPVANTAVYILDKHQQVVPVGVVGELHLGGAGLARGYYQRPELTREKFITNPFAMGSAGGRLYRTGDLGRYLADGNIEYLGRTDNQVKVRGYRIELGEIEAVLAQHGAIKESVVIAREDEPGDKRLVAYLVCKGDLSISELRSQLKQQLPEYMIPATFVLLDALPISPNGKVDRGSLPMPDHSRPELDGSFVAARTAIEEILVSIWAEVLGVEKVSINDNFFDLGGHSLLATQLISRIQDAFQTQLTLRTLFESPTIAGLAQRLEAINAALVPQGEQTGMSVLLPQPEHSLNKTPILPIPRQGELPLSFAQQRLWFIDQLEPGSPVYNIPAAVLFKGSLNVPVLEQTLNEILRRHESLRTSFTMVAGQPSQVIAPVLTLSLPVIDLSALSAAERKAQLEQLAADEASTPFDLSQVPLLRATILTLAAKEHVLLLTMHHIVSDGWSMGVMIRELVALYESFSSGNPSPLPELPVQYSDFAHWQQQRLEAESLQRQFAYWKEQLKGETALLELPADRPRPPTQTFRGANLSIVIPQRLSLALKAMSRREGVTLFMTLLAAFKLLLYRYTAQQDISIGTVIANRNRSELEGLIGFFANTLVLRSDMSGNPGFIEFLRRVRDISLGAYANQDLPFEKLVKELHPDRDLSRTPLIQVMFILQNTPLPILEFSGLTVKPLEHNGKVARLDLTLSTTETKEGLHTSLEYNTDLFDEATIRRMLGHLQRLLQGIADNPEQRLSEIPLLTQAEHKQLVDWNQTRKDYPSFQTLHQLFEQQVEKSPQALAFIFGREQVSYQELNQRANQLAHYLRKLGVGPEVLVGICVERSIEMVIAILAILKAGGAYLPLDPTYPRERLAFMLRDAQLEVLVTQQQLLNILPAPAARVVCLDTIREVVACESSANPSHRSSADSLGYVIYTSGSTGNPKGVLGLHRGAINRFNWMWETYPFEAGEICCQKTSLGFGDSIWEIFGPLLKGVAALIIPDELLKDPENLIELLAAERVTRIVLVPSLLRAILKTEVDLANSLPSLKYWISSGEALSTELSNLLKEKRPSSVLINLYGSCEVSADATCYETGSREELSSIPIGRPIANTAAYILDKDLQPVPVGVAGELYLGGDGLARGYLNRPGLTAEKFITHPCSGDGGAAGARLYRTGDLARYLADGNIEYLGRIDHQVKIRGFRVEPGEIEAVLAQHPAVKESVVIARLDKRAEKQLVAYLVADCEQRPTSNQLRTLLKERLPEYMIPAAYAYLEAMPLTPSGKLDRQALPEPEYTNSDRGYRVPGNAIEEIIAGIWSELLGVARVGVDDNFFELGGHSLLATQVISRVRESLQVEIAVGEFFQLPVLASFAQQIERAARGDRSCLAKPIAVQSRAAGLPLSYAQQRLWFLDQLMPGNAGYHLPVALRLRGSLDVEALSRTVNEIVRRHESLRTRFETVAGEPVQVIAAELELKLSLVDLSSLAAEEAEKEVIRLAHEEARRPFTLGAGPLLRTTLVKLAEQEHVVVLVMHHIVSDGWSMGVLVRELGAVYEAYCEGKPSPLPELPIQYADFAVWQRERLAAVKDEQLGYWQQQLAEVSRLQLPLDHPRPAVPSFHGATKSFVIKRELLAELKTLSQSHGVTLFMTLLAAFKVLLSRYSGQADIAVGTPIANRQRAELEPLIGFFVNTLVLRTDVANDPSFAELMGRVRAVALGAYQHQELPFAQLVEELQPERSLSQTPLFQVMFVLQNAPLSELALGDLELTPVAVESGIARFELTLVMEETAAGLTGTLEYNRDLFAAETISRMAGHLESLLAAIVTDPSQRISELPLLTAAEQRHLLVEWNETAADYATDKCIHKLFEQQTVRTPGAIAVVDGEQALTYSELNLRANQLAHYLKALGVGTEVVVGICVERSVELVVGWLGILKAGAAYLPIDPAYPAERIAFILAESCSPVVLTQARLVERLGGGQIWSAVTCHRFGPCDPSPEVATEELLEGSKAFSEAARQQAAAGQSGDRSPHSKNGSPQHQREVFCLDADWGQVSGCSEQNPVNESGAEQLAYVIYTSGSTGRPKGVEIEHGSLLNLVQWHQRSYGIGPSSRASQLAGPGFDAAGWEIWPYLATGGSIHITPEEIRNSPAALVKWLGEESITISFLPTPLAEAVMVEAWPAGIALQDVLTGGDQLQRRPGRELPFRLVNHYGPTESTVVATATVVEAGPGGRPAIGKPVANTAVYILDKHQQVVPVGVAGELHLGGAGLARGYYQRPELTREKFITNPFAMGSAGGRLYRTGDLGRYLADGNIEYLGRTDNQVKVRGYRIELGEIEAVLAQHGAIKESVVIVREDEPGDRRLVAYLVCKGDLSISELRSFLQATLPGYMVPSAFVELAAIPVTPNGKVDRRALASVPAPTTIALSEVGSDHIPPRDIVELQLLHIWEELLNVSPIGVRDNFFDLGGHSLLAVRLMAHIQRRFGQTLFLSNLLQEATIERLARVIRQEAVPSPGSALVGINPNGSKRPFFCVHPTGGNVLCYFELAGLLGTDQPFYGFQSPGLDGAQPPLKTIEGMAAHYIEALLAIQPEGPYLLGGWSLGGVVAFEMAQQLQRQNHEVALLALLDIHTPLYKYQQVFDDAWVMLSIIKGENLSVSYDDLRQLDPDKQLTHILEIAKRANRFPPDLAVAHIRHLVEVHKANLRALYDYTPEVYDNRITLFRASERPELLRVNHSDAEQLFQDPTLGWGQLSGQPVEVEIVPGTHESILLKPSVQVLADKLKNYLDSVATPSKGMRHVGLGFAA